MMTAYEVLALYTHIVSEHVESLYTTGCNRILELHFVGTALSSVFELTTSLSEKHS